jgi:hypothetical protein
MMRLLLWVRNSKRLLLLSAAGQAPSPACVVSLELGVHRRRRDADGAGFGAARGASLLATEGSN